MEAGGNFSIFAGSLHFFNHGSVKLSTLHRRNRKPKLLEAGKRITEAVYDLFMADILDVFLE